MTTDKTDPGRFEDATSTSYPAANTRSRGDRLFISDTDEVWTNCRAPGIAPFWLSATASVLVDGTTISHTGNVPGGALYATGIFNQADSDQLAVGTTTVNGAGSITMEGQGADATVSLWGDAAGKSFPLVEFDYVAGQAYVSVGGLLAAATGTASVGLNAGSTATPNTCSVALQASGIIVVQSTIAGTYAEFQTNSVTRFGYSDLGVQLTHGSLDMSANGFTTWLLTNHDASGSAGNATCNTQRGRVKFAQGASSLTLSNNLIVGTTSTLLVTIQSATVDATATGCQAVCTGAGAGTIHLNATVTGAGGVIVDFVLFN
jgi:hypothetical protein